MSDENHISFSRDVAVYKLTHKKGEVLIRRQLRFIDNFRFFASSFDALATNFCVEQCKEL